MEWRSLKQEKDSLPAAFLMELEGEESFDMASRFDDSLTNFTEAITALAIYTKALKATAVKDRPAGGDRHLLKETATVDVLDKIARQLDRATLELQGLYARTEREDRASRPRSIDLDVA